MSPELLTKPLCEWSASEYRAYVRSLYWKKPKRIAAKKKLAPFKWRKNAKGTLIIKFNRDWISESDLQQIASESGTPLAEVWIKVFKPKSKTAKRPRLSDAATEEKRAKTLVIPEL